MESEEITKLVDGVYKNILEKFNPGARQLITAGKVYLKALHGAAQASRQFNEALAKIAINAQQSGTNDIGAALMSVVNVNKDIQEQQMNILKAFYVDLLVPLETNLEKDTKVVQHEQKKFMQQHKVRMESYQKAVSTMKKQRKKKSSPENTEKELRSLQLLEDQKKKLDAFCEQSYKNAMTQERRRYGFVLERQCSIAKHWMVYHTTGKQVIDNNFENWQDIAASREVIPATAYDSSFILAGNKRMERIKEADDGVNNSSMLKKSRSVDAPYGDMRTLHETSERPMYSQNSLPRAKSDYNLNTVNVTTHEHSEHGHWDQRPVVRALYAYMPSGENQLPFDEGDRIALVGSKAKGWQFGENLRTQMFGWFPIAYTNADSAATDFKQKLHHEHRNERSERYENVHYGGTGSGGMRGYQDQFIAEERDVPSTNSTINDNTMYRRRNVSAEESSPTRMFGDTINLRNQKKYRPTSVANPRPGPPPTLPAPVPTGQNAGRSMLNSSQSFCAPNGQPSAIERRKHKLQNGPQIAHQSSMNHLNQSGSGANATKAGGAAAGSGNATAAKTSLHSSNDSGFANEPPPQPEVDYSDEEQNARVPIRRRADTNSSSPREIASWTLNRNFRNSVDSQIDDKSLSRLHSRNSKMRYDLIASDDEILQASSGGIKRTKSFWKFGGGRSDDILAGMSLWQHRDLVAAPNLDELRDEKPSAQRSGSQLDREQTVDADDNDDQLTKTGTLTKSHNSNSSNEKRHKESVTSMEMYDDDENIYGMTPLPRENGHSMLTPPSSQQRNIITNTHASFTPKSRMKIMKTIEIDIENPTDVENLSTLKRGQKQYQKDYRDMNLMTATLTRNLKENGANLKESSNSGGKTKLATRQPEKKHLNNGQQHSAHKPNNNASGQGGQVGKQQSVPRGSQHRNMQHSTDEHDDDDDDDLDDDIDDDESDDNGTLKMSDVNNFFDDLSHDHNGNAGLIMKTVKRKDILKQYYTSEDETDEVRKDEKLRRHLHANSYHEQQQMEFQTFRASASSTPGPTNGNIGQSNGTSTKKSTNDKQQSDRRERSSATPSNKMLLMMEREEERERERYNGSSTLTRNQNSNQQSNSTTSSTGGINTPTATILPRTRLMKSSMTLERAQQRTRREQQEQQRENEQQNGGGGGAGIEKSKSTSYGHKTYGPWYDFWDQQQEQPHSQKAGGGGGNSSKL